MEEGGISLSKSRTIHAPLLRAVLADDWKAAEDFIQNHPNCLTAKITKEEGTALHSAAVAKRPRFVKNLVELMTPEDLELKTNENCTALYFAAQSEIVTIAEVMVTKNENLTSICENGVAVLPLYAAIMTGNRDMMSYLYSKTPVEKLPSDYLIYLLSATIYTDSYDIAHKIMDALKLQAPEEKKLTPEENKLLWFSLEMLAGKPLENGSKSRPSVWEKCLNSGFRGCFCNKATMQASAHQLVDRLLKQFEDDSYMKLLVEAAKVGNVEFIIKLISSYPDLIWQHDEEDGSLFHVAIKYRQESVFNLIYETGAWKDNLAHFTDKEENNMLHLVGELPASSDRLNIVPGAAFQMQRELLWFQEIEKLVPKFCVTRKNKNEKIPWDLFMEKHENLRKNGEKWMKNTANYCMLVAALIATVVFPVAFTVPGGNNQETGTPIFLESNWFTIFFLSDALAMLFSSSSILVFLSILMWRYTTKDFLVSLPRRLVLGLVTLLISIVGMLIAFTAACFLVFKRKTSVPIRIIVTAPAVPISLFVILHFRLWLDIFRSAFCSERFLFRSQNRLFKKAS